MIGINTGFLLSSESFETSESRNYRNIKDELRAVSFNGSLDLQFEYAFNKGFYFNIGTGYQKHLINIFKDDAFTIYKPDVLRFSLGLRKEF